MINPYNQTLIRCFLLAGVLAFGAACDENGGAPADPCSNDFDQPAMFANLADNRIVPLYAELNQDVQALQTTAAAFAAAPDVTALDALRTAWKEAYLSWQRAGIFEFGPAAEIFLRNSLNNFPLNVQQVEQNVATGSYDLDNPNAFDKGFPALDYLLFGLGDTPAAVVDQYVSGDKAAGYRRYLTDVVADMAERVAAVQQAWSTGGYRAIFVNNTGTAAGTSLSLVINNLNEHYETIKRDRIGIPGGAVTLGFTNPTKVEAFYSGISAELALEAVRASRAFYLGESLNGANGQGLDDLLNHVGAQKNGRALDAVIKEQYEAAITATAAVPAPLSQSVDQQAALVQKAYNELTKQVVNLKTDLPAVLCVAITYVDNPSDSD